MEIGNTWKFLYLERMANKKTRVEPVKETNRENFTENLTNAFAALATVISKLQFPGFEIFSCAIAVVLAAHDGKNLRETGVE